MPRLELCDVSKYYGRIKALEKVNLTVEDGEYLAVIGPSGCGKSTMLKVIAGIVEPTRGDVRVDGRSIVGLPPEDRGVGFIFQNLALFPHMTGLENSMYGLLTRETATDEALNMVRKLRMEFGFRARLSRLPGELSMGEQQEVAILRAVASGAKIMLLDEPLSSIDAKVAVEVRRKLREVVKSKGLTALHVTHNQEEAMSVADRIAVMRKGRILQVGKPEELYYKPRSPFVMAFVGDASFLTGTCRGGRAVVRGGYDLGPCDMPEGELIVIGVRPESIVFGRGIPGKVRLRSYLGSLIRYEVELENGDIVTAVSEEEQGENVKVWFEKYKVFKYPREGLTEALSPG